MRILTPLHVSGIWIPRYSDNPLETGSIGAGLNIALYTIAETTRGPCRIILNNQEVFPEQASRVCLEAGVDVETKIYSPVELGRGFAVSSAIFTSHALGGFLTAGKPSLKALQLAHVLEVSSRTGLGDVIAQYTGGFVIRLKPGPPGIGLAYRVIPRGRVRLLVTSMSGVEYTGVMLSRMNKSLLEYGEELFKIVANSEDLRVFFENSYLFTKRLFDYTIVDEILRGVRGIVGYYLKKSALVIWVEEEYTGEVLEYLSRKGFKPQVTSISPMGIHIAHPRKPPKENKSTNT